MNGFADDLSKGDQQPVEPFFLLIGQQGFQALVALLGCFGMQKSPKVENTVDMCVDGDDVLAKSAFQDDGGGFWADTLDLEKLRFGVGDFAVAAFQQIMGDIENGLRLFAVETDRIDRLFYGLFGERDHLFRCVGQGEEPFTRCLRHLVFGTEAERHGDRDRKWCTTVAIVALLGRRVPFGIFPF